MRVWVHEGWEHGRYGSIWGVGLGGRWKYGDRVRQ